MMDIRLGWAETLYLSIGRRRGVGKAFHSNCESGEEEEEEGEKDD